MFSCDFYNDFCVARFRGCEPNPLTFWSLVLCVQIDKLYQILQDIVFFDDRFVYVYVAYVDGTMVVDFPFEFGKRDEDLINFCPRLLLLLLSLLLLVVPLYFVGILETS